MKKLSNFYVVGLFLCFGLLPLTARAVTVDFLTGIPVKGDYAVEPGKTEVNINPGEQTEKVIKVTNRMGQEMRFKIDLEDFAGSKNPNESIVLMGAKKGPYSLKDYLHPEVTEFTLKHGERISIPVKIQIPATAEPGGLYGAVIVRTVPIKPEVAGDKDSTSGQISVISRLASLVLVRINGPVKEEGNLTQFKTDKSWYEKGPLEFSILTENNGSVHLTNAGTVAIYNLLGSKVGEFIVDPYFTLPDSVKLRKISWDRGMLFGRYRADLDLNLGYQNKTVQASAVFWVVPWKITLPGFIGIVLVCWLIIWALSNLEIKKKQKV